MNTSLKQAALGAIFVTILGAIDASDVGFDTSDVGFNLVGSAEAGLVVAPVRRAAVVTTVAVASTSASASAASQANAAAASQANAQAAQANAAAANANAAAAASKAAAPAGPPPVGTMVTTLPPGCVDTNLNGVDYMRCGSSYFKPSMVGNNLVFVVAQP